MTYIVTCKDRSTFEFTALRAAERFFDVNDGVTLASTERTALLRSNAIPFYRVYLEDSRVYKFRLLADAVSFADNVAAIDIVDDSWVSILPKHECHRMRVHGVGSPPSVDPRSLAWNPGTVIKERHVNADDMQLLGKAAQTCLGRGEVEWVDGPVTREKIGSFIEVDDLQLFRRAVSSCLRSGRLDAEFRSGLFCLAAKFGIQVP
jgi:hypothetical protein